MYCTWYLIDMVNVHTCVLNQIDFVQCTSSIDVVYNEYQICLKG